MSPLITKTCEECGRQFKANSPVAVTCSELCRINRRLRRQKELAVKRNYRPL